MDRKPFTFETLTTKQAIFDYVVAHLRKQGEPAIGGEYTSCVYREHDPRTGRVLMCAVGCLIPDYLYLPRYENDSVSGVLDEIDNHLQYNGERMVAPRPDDFDLLRRFLSDNERLLSDLQHAHDEWAEEPGLMSMGKAERLRQLDEHLVDVAERHGVTIPTTVGEPA